MKSSLAHLSPTVLAFGAAIGLSLSLFLLSGAGLPGGAVPLLPALGGAAKNVAAKPLASERPHTPARVTTAVSAASAPFVPQPAVTASPPAAPTPHPVRPVRTRVRP